MVSAQTRRLVRQRARYLCEYCHSPEYLSPDRFTIDHIMPQSLGGSDELDNLALACHRCNERHYNFTARRFWVEAGWHPPQSDPYQK
ncbi:MAG: HNH endonuclease signature motif containing protein [Rhizonema sp. NSF051]|nr:HNH endonuclease signature motif containing protein [Rhizonema sp. NSF051]